MPKPHCSIGQEPPSLVFSLQTHSALRLIAMIWKAIFTALVIPLTMLPSIGCSAWTQANVPSVRAETVAPRSVSSPEPIRPDSSVPDATQLRSLQPCLKKRSKLQVLHLSFRRVDGPGNDQQEPQTNAIYFSAYSSPSIDRPYLFETGKVPKFTAIALAANQCSILKRSAAKALAKKLIGARYPDLTRLSNGDLEAVKGDVVNQWEQDRRVSGADDAPFEIDIEDIWAFTTLKLGLPDYAPIKVHRPSD